LIGGNGGKRTVTAILKYAVEWNCSFQTVGSFSAMNTHLHELLAEAGREQGSVRRSLMTGCLFGKNDAALQEKIAARKRTFDDLRARGIVLGNAAQVKEQLHELEYAGVQRVMLQWLDLDDLAGLEALAKAVL
jgi:alkanesulfonate monooxygenase SsuD/methylene tetrahydromethanopterin reductase-like flavin-dependent oxidoreductase (luciferase family)